MVTSLVFLRKPIITGQITKQTIYLWLLNVCHLQSKNAQPTALLVDDDSGYGICSIKRICDELGIKATFAVIPSRLDSILCDSLRQWQQDGYHIALHGYNHNRWEKWTSKDIINDIEQCEQLLQEKGFEKAYQYIVPPHANNTRNIRNAIKAKGYKMITGANIVNLDTTVFQVGRFSLGKDDPDIKDAKIILTKAFHDKSFVIFGTHSSIKDCYSEERTKAVLKLAIEIGLNFI